MPTVCRISRVSCSISSIGTIAIALTLFAAPAFTEAAETAASAHRPRTQTSSHPSVKRGEKSAPRKVASRDKTVPLGKSSPQASKPGPRTGTVSSKKPSPKRACLGPMIPLDRGGIEPETFALVDCGGRALEDARERLSILARPWGAARPEPQAIASPSKNALTAKRAATPKATPQKSEIAKHVRMLDEGLLTRIAKIAAHFPGKTISLVSGYRPESRGSLHQTARALDLRVAGVENVDLAAFCRTLPDTGCGFYPNSSFVHVDVRTKATGSATWIDASGPGEAPQYVTAWPPPRDRSDHGDHSENSSPPAAESKAALPELANAPRDASAVPNTEEEPEPVSPHQVSDTVPHP